MAGHKGHEFIRVKDVDHQLRHEVNSDELRVVVEESVEGLREHFYWQKSRKSEAGQRRAACCRMRRDTLPSKQYYTDLMSGE